MLTAQQGVALQNGDSKGDWGCCPNKRTGKAHRFRLYGYDAPLASFANSGPSALLANAHSGALFALLASFFYPVPASKNCAAKTKKRDWRIFRSRFGKASRASGYTPASRFHREAPNPYPHVVIRARRVVAFFS